MGGTRRLYALIVGIDTYQKVRNLSEAVKDAKKLDHFLISWCQQQEVAYHPLELHNQAATRQAILAGFQQHLTQATAQDLILFYFSGHGSREPLPEALSTQSQDGHGETIVAVDSRQPGIPDISDKELRYLIHRLSQQQAYIVCLFDCCHAGTNTRMPDATPKYSVTGGKRKWKQYLFSERYPTEASFQAAGGLNVALPEGPHLQIGACEKEEVAYEQSGQGGIFTQQLIQLLTKSQGNISYHALRNRIKHAINRQHYPQTPQIYVYGSEHHKFLPFLLGHYPSDIRQGNVIWDVNLQAWILDQGAVHGILPSIAQQQSRISIYTQNKEKVTEALPKAVGFAHTQLAMVTDNRTLERTELYKGQVPTTNQQRLQLYLDSKAKAILEQVDPAITSSLSSSMQLVANEELAAYVIRHNDQHRWSITYPFDQRPIIAPLEKSKSRLLRIYCEQISRWERSLQLVPDQSVRTSPIALEMLNSKNETMPIQQGVITGQYTNHPSPTSPATSYTLRIHNQSRDDLYFALLGFTHQFGVYTHWLGEQMVKVKSKQYLERQLTFVLPPYIQKDKWPYSPTWFKLIAAPIEADLSQLALEELPEPYSMVKHKGIGPPRRVRRTDPLAEWYTQVLEFRLRNPILDLIVP